MGFWGLRFWGFRVSGVRVFQNLGFRIKPPFALALFALLAVVPFLLQCFKALHSKTLQRIYKVNKRKLAEEAEVRAT